MSILTSIAGALFSNGKEVALVGQATNLIINPNMAINQRNFNGSSFVDGQYCWDRWKATATAMVQTVEDGNYEYSTTYTLSGDNVTTTTMTSPASGHWTLPEIPRIARKVVLVKSSKSGEYHQRLIGEELVLCQRYYQLIYNQRFDFYNNSVNSDSYFVVQLITTMRVNPNIVAQNIFTTLTGLNYTQNPSQNFIQVNATGGVVGDNNHSSKYIADAEIY